jgi:hypothetical protein
MSALYDSIRERLLYGTFSWQTADLEVEAWSAGVFDPKHIRVSDITAAGGVKQSKSTLLVGPPWVVAGGYAAADSVILPGSGFTVGATISYLTLSDKSGSNTSDPLLILFIDDAEGLPFVANGLDYVVTPDWLLRRGWWRP